MLLDQLPKSDNYRDGQNVDSRRKRQRQHFWKVSTDGCCAIPDTTSNSDDHTRDLPKLLVERSQVLACLKVAKFFLFELPLYLLKLFGVFMLDSFQICVVDQCYGPFCYLVPQSNWFSWPRRDDDWVEPDSKACCRI